jgi:preprotein translocase subunit SecE
LGNFGTGGAQFEHAPQLSGGCIFLTILNWIKIINSKSKIGLMNKISAYFRDSYRELLEKVTWPSWAQLQQSTVIVLVATVIITAVVWLMDLASNGLLRFIYSIS